VKLLISCMKCLEEFGHPTDEMSRVEFCDNGRYEITCSHGHKTVTILQQQKFEILFEIGANAIIDGYYREAVSSFTSSLELFYEFCIRVFMQRVNNSEELLRRGWKEISNQSERQLGAFIFLWIYCIGEMPDLPSRKQNEFRNDVIHKGKIPTKEEALIYGNEILKVVRPKIKLIQEKYPDEVRKEVFCHLHDVRKGSDSNLKTATMCVSTIISLNIGDKNHHEKTFEEALVGIKTWREIAGV